MRLYVIFSKAKEQLIPPPLPSRKCFWPNFCVGKLKVTEKKYSLPFASAAVQMAAAGNGLISFPENCPSHTSKG